MASCLVAPDSKALSTVDRLPWLVGFTGKHCRLPVPMEPTMGILRSSMGLSLPEGISFSWADRIALCCLWAGLLTDGGADSRQQTALFSSSLGPAFRGTSGRVSLPLGA